MTNQSINQSIIVLCQTQQLHRSIENYKKKHTNVKRKTDCKGVDCLHYITCCIYCIVGLSMAGIV